jgi:hypothetical protein
MSGNGSYASAGDLLSALALRHEDVEIDVGVGVTKHVLVWELTAREVQKLQEVLQSWRREARGVGTTHQETVIVAEPTGHLAILRLAWLALKDANGRRLFEHEDDAGRLPQRALEKIFAKAAELTPGLFAVPTAAVAEEVVAETGKGSEPTPGDSSTSPSRRRSGSRASEPSTND